MKTLIIYYSKTWNTKRVALDLARELECDIEEIIDKKKRTWFWWYLLGWRDAMKKVLTEIETTKNNPSEYDLVIIWMPVWGWNLTPATRTYLIENETKIKNYAFFVTSWNTPAEKLTPYFQETTKKDPIALTGFNTTELKNTEIYEKKLKDFIEKIKRFNT